LLCGRVWVIVRSGAGLCGRAGAGLCGRAGAGLCGRAGMGFVDGRAQGFACGRVWNPAPTGRPPSALCSVGALRSDMEGTSLKEGGRDGLHESAGIYPPCEGGIPPSTGGRGDFEGDVAYVASQRCDVCRSAALRRTCRRYICFFRADMIFCGRIWVSCGRVWVSCGRVWVSCGRVQGPAPTDGGLGAKPPYPNNSPFPNFWGRGWGERVGMLSK
jgi:hypothetical protein